jgi:hypothetical protein
MCRFLDGSVGCLLTVICFLKVPLQLATRGASTDAVAKAGSSNSPRKSSPPGVVGSTDKAEKISKAMKAYLERTQAYGKIAINAHFVIDLTHSCKLFSQLLMHNIFCLLKVRVKC